jgi:hypothetical protein
MILSLDYSHLKERQRSEGESYPENLFLRVHRALNWLHRAESCQKHFDGQFSLCNAFGAATFSQFVTKTCDVDQNEDLTTWEGDFYPCKSINMDNM